jgi:hypothetical protein
MSLAALAQADTASIIALDGESVALTSPPGVDQATYLVPVIKQHAGATVDGEGLRVVAESISITVSTQALAVAGILDPEVLKAKDWTVLIGTQSYRLTEAPIDYTRGLVDIVLRKARA